MEISALLVLKKVWINSYLSVAVIWAPSHWRKLACVGNFQKPGILLQFHTSRGYYCLFIVYFETEIERMDSYWGASCFPANWSFPAINKNAIQQRVWGLQIQFRVGTFWWDDSSIDSWFLPQSSGQWDSAALINSIGGVVVIP